MDGVYNRKLFAKKSQEARNALREMGGVDPMPPQMGGILASSPELMQAAAMRRPVVLPSSTTPSQQPMPAPQPQMLPPSSPLPNIAGIPQTQAPAPRPMAQKPGVRKLNEGGEPIPAYMKGAAEVFSIASDLNPQLRTFKDAFKFGQRAITTEDPAKLGLPEGTNMNEPAEMLKDPEAAAADIIADTVPKDQQTGDTKTDLRKAATMTGIERVPAEAEIDELNKAIFGAKLAGAISGSYVNPNTGQELRPTLGARMSQAAVEGLAVARDTETRRAKQEAELAAAKIKAAGKSTSGKNWMGTDQGKAFMKLWQEYSGDGNRSVQEVLADIKEVAPGLVAEAVASGYIADTPAQTTPTASGGGQVVVEGEIIYSVDANGNKVQVGTYDAETNTAKDMSGNVVKPRQ